MFRRRRPATHESGDSRDSALATPKDAEGTPTLLDIAYPLQQVRVRWHTLDGGEVMIPGQIQSVNGELVEIWFDRSAPSFSPLHSDDQVLVDASCGEHTYVFSGWLVGLRPPDTLVVLVKALPRRDQRRQYVRERVDLPPQSLVAVDGNGDPTGPEQEVTVLDLSGGGIRLQLSEPIPVDCTLQITLDVGNGPFDTLLTPIQTYTTAAGRQVMRCAFSRIEERYRRCLIRFVFHEQLRKARLARP